MSASSLQSLSDTRVPSGRWVAATSPVTNGERGNVEVNQLLVSMSDGRHRLGHEAVNVDPVAVLLGLQHELRSVLDEPEMPAELLGLGSRGERDRLDQRPQSEADISEQPLPAVTDAQHEVRPRADGARRRPETDAREHRLDLAAETRKPAREQQVLLKAVPAASLLDELALELLGLERDRNAAMRVEVLERDRHHVRAVQLGHRRARSPRRSARTYASKSITMPTLVGATA